MSKKRESIAKELWPESIKDQGAIVLYPDLWSKHAGTEVSEKYQVEIVGRLSPPKNYINESEAGNYNILPDLKIKSSFGQLRGISATGKGTRICQLILYLITKYKWTYKYENNLASYFNDEYNNKKLSEPPLFTAPIGIYFPELNLIILGAKFVRSTKSRLLSLTGCDALNTGFGYNTMLELTERYAKQGYNVLCEGYVSMCSSDLNIKNQHKYGHTNFFYKCFQHDNKEDMLERFKSRSFHVAKGDAAWSQNEMHGKLSYEALIKDKDELSGQLGKLIIWLNDPKELVWKFGIEYLEFLGLNQDAVNFAEFSQNVDANRDYRDAERNYDQLWYLWKFQNQVLEKPVCTRKIYINKEDGQDIV